MADFSLPFEIRANNLGPLEIVSPVESIRGSNILQVSGFLGRRSLLCSPGSIGGLGIGHNCMKKEKRKNWISRRG